MSIPQITHMRAGVERQMRHRCTIQRNTASGTDPLGNPLPAGWSDLATDVPCYVWQGAGKGLEGKQGEAQTADILATLDTWSLMLPVGTDVAERDRISVVTDMYDTQWNRTPLNILSIQRRNTHLLAICQEAR